MSKKILIVDDDPSILRLLDSILRKKGYEVIITNNGIQGLKKARTEKPDLIILDLMLPGVDGFEICDRLTQEPETKNIPFLVLSAKGQEEDKASASELGATAYFTKPINHKSFSDYIDQILASKTAST